jgi:uncharacterized protein
MRRFGVVLSVLLLVVVLHDTMVGAPHGLGSRAAVFAIDEYRAHVSPRLKGVITCRFRPTCSYYGKESIRKHGLLIGGAKTITRIVRCGPWTKQGTFDPP